MKGSKSDRERQIPYDMAYMWNLKYHMNKHIYKTDSQTERPDLWLARRRRVEGQGLGVWN